MMYLDTHVVAWLYANRVDLLSECVRKRVEDQEVLVSPMVNLVILDGGELFTYSFLV